jgi:hypothetical protein
MENYNARSRQHSATVAPGFLGSIESLVCLFNPVTMVMDLIIQFSDAQANRKFYFMAFGING